VSLAAGDRIRTGYPSVRTEATSKGDAICSNDFDVDSRLAERLASANAEALIRDHGGEAYSGARQRERDVTRPNGTTHAGPTPAHWRRVALIVARMTGKRVGLDTATRMLERRPPDR
jgi:hypothetical protein